MCDFRAREVWFFLGLMASGLLQNLPAALATEKEGGNRYALLIGVDDYVHGEKLRFCGANVRALSEQLTAAGFAPDHICLLHDKAEQSERRPLKSSIERELGNLLKQTGKNDLVIVAFSGRGVELDGKRYLLPADANPNDRASLLSVVAVLEQLGTCPAAVKLLVTDASRQDVRPVGQRPTSSGKAAFSQPLEPPPKGVVFFSSCGPGQLAHVDSGWGQGVFIHFLIEGLRGGADADGNGHVTFMELYVFTAGKTKQYVAQKFKTVQTPVLRGDMEDDFVLSRVKVDK